MTANNRRALATLRPVRKPRVSRLHWTAARDGIGHAWRSARGYTLCALWPIEERYCWPMLTRCVDCVRALEMAA